MTRQFLPIAIMTAAVSGCGDQAALRPLASSAERSDAIREEFLETAEAIESSENPYLGRHQISRLQSSLAQPNVSHQDKVNLLLQLCWHHLRLGNIDAAAATIAEAYEEVNANNGRPSASMHKLRAIVYLREAEYRNCVQKHNHECCVFPLAGGGIHSEKEPMQQARKSLLDWLALSPQDLEAGWLLNISGMALGGYPESIPEAYRLPQKLFESGDDVGRFIDVAPVLGVDALNLCGGAIAEDFDGDGLLDIVTSTYDPRGPLTYYRNAGNGTFVDESDASGLASQLGGLNCIAADYDNDSDADILVLRGAWLEDEGRIRNSLLRNNGDGTFSDVTNRAGLDQPVSPTQAAVWGDFDNDGWLDLYIGNESRVELGDTEGDHPSQLFHNQGDGTFRDIAPSAGVTNDRYCKGVAAGDFDNDGDLDLYTSNRGANRLYRNNGDLTFTDIAADTSVVEPSQQSFACWFFDYDNDGWLDLFVAAYQSTNADVAADYIGIPHNGTYPGLYHNRGDGTFENVTTSVGLDRALLPMGANFGDTDSDGFLDIYLTTGRPDFAALTPNVFFRNDSGQRFQDITFAVGLGHLQKGHGVAFADLDNDGDQDIYHQLGGFYPGDKFHNALFLNPLVEQSSDPKPKYVTISLVGTTCNRQAVGARLRVITKEGESTKTYHRAAGMVSSFGGSPARQEIGLGAADSIVRIEVDWPGSRTTQQFHDVPINSFIQIIQGDNQLRTVPRTQLNLYTPGTGRVAER